MTRKGLKKLRYSIEFLSPRARRPLSRALARVQSPGHRDKQAKAYLHVIAKLLKHLGSLNDAVVVVALAERLGGERQPELAPAAAALAAWAARRQDKAHRYIQRDWHNFKSTGALQ